MIVASLWRNSPGRRGEPETEGGAKEGERAHPPGNLYRCEYKALTKKWIRKTMKIKTLQIDRPRGAICKFVKTKEGQK